MKLKNSKVLKQQKNKINEAILISNNETDLYCWSPKEIESFQEQWKNDTHLKSEANYANRV